MTLCSYSADRRHGQRVNTPMCVVVQQMVNSDVSGVMFTVDPVTGNNRHITITANYGLGEVSYLNEEFFFSFDSH